MWEKKKILENYYSNFPKRLVLDYLYGNRRSIKAIKFILSKIEEESYNILDIGCGIGWSSFEIAKKSKSKVIGIDLSENSIVSGKKIFKRENLTLQKGDILTDIYQENFFDIISFIDVFEHVPIDKRETLYEIINKILTVRAKVLITSPTVYHQSYLRTNKPEGLQPVDEDIDIEVLGDFASKIGGEISYFSYESVWQKNDYLHCSIERGFNYNDLMKRNRIKSLESCSKRYRRINSCNIDKEIVREFKRSKIKDQKSLILQRIKKPLYFLKKKTL